MQYFSLLYFKMFCSDSLLFLVKLFLQAPVYFQLFKSLTSDDPFEMVPSSFRLSFKNKLLPELLDEVITSFLRPIADFFRQISQSCPYTNIIGDYGPSDHFNFSLFRLTVHHAEP